MIKIYIVYTAAGPQSIYVGSNEGLVKYLDKEFANVRKYCWAEEVEVVLEDGIFMNLFSKDVIQP